MPGVDLMEAEYPTHAFPLHVHEEYVVAVMERGADAVFCRGRSHVAPAGTLLVINAGDAHDGQAADGRVWAYRAMYPPVPMLLGISRDLTEQALGAPNFSEPVVHDDALVAEFRAVYELLAGFGGVLEIQSRLLVACANLVMRHAHERTPEPPAIGRELVAIRRIKDYLHAHVADETSLDALATLTGLSRFRVIRLFARYTGLTPHAYLSSLRIQRARHLLMEGRSIVEATLDAGFFDQSHFTRHFRRIVGVTPGAFVREIRQR